MHIQMAFAARRRTTSYIQRHALCEWPLGLLTRHADAKSRELLSFAFTAAVALTAQTDVKI